MVAVNVRVYVAGAVEKVKVVARQVCLAKWLDLKRINIGMLIV